MKHLDQFYINGGWVKPSGEAKAHEVINPATEASEGTVYLAGKADVDAAIQAARDAFEGFAATPLEERLAMLEKIMGLYQSRLDDMAEAISREMGAPRHSLAAKVQAPMGLAHAKTGRAHLPTDCLRHIVQAGRVVKILKCCSTK